MLQKITLITNNRLVYEQLAGKIDVQYLETDFAGVLIAVRDAVQAGHKLLTHPLSGSIKPGETPYKSVIISQKSEKLDFQSLSIIENSIEKVKSFTTKYSDLSNEVQSDFMLIDLDLIKGALQ